MIRTTRLYWVLQLSGWGLIFGVNALFTALFSPQLLVRSLATYVLCGLSGILLSHAFRAQLKRKPLASILEKSPWPYLLAPFVLGILQTSIAGVLFRIFLVPKAFRQLAWVPGALTVWTVTFILWTALYVAIGQVRKGRETERQRRAAELAAKDARLSALRNQVNPHFLFNSLNSIRALIFEDSAKAAQMIDKLAAMLRYSLRSEEKPVVTLAEEMEVVREYLDIETIRFEERLQVQTDVSDTALPCRLPSMLIQTLVENAVKHGIETRPGGGTIQIEAEVRESELQVTVSNPGSLQRSSGSTRIGLTNAAQQLALSMGTGAGLVLTEAGGMVQARVVIPQGGRA